MIPDFQMRWLIIAILKMDKEVVNAEGAEAGEKWPGQIRRKRVR
jgi:hypothetical protein